MWIVGCEGMTKKAKIAQRGVGRPEGRKPLLNLRVEQTLHDRLTAAAGKSGRTISEETVSRLTRTFADEEFYGTELRRVIDMFAAAFWLGGKQAAASAEKDPTPSEWLQDQECFRAAVVKAAVTMIECMPMATPDEKELTLIALQGRLAAGLIRSGELVFTDERGKPMKSGFQGSD